MPAEQLVLEAPPIEKPWWERGVWANGQRPDISERPSLMARYALMAGIKHQVLKLVAFIHKNVINAHHFKIDNIVFAVINVVLQRLELNFQILFAYDYTFEHST